MNKWKIVGWLGRQPCCSPVLLSLQCVALAEHQVANEAVGKVPIMDRPMVCRNNKAREQEHWTTIQGLDASKSHEPDFTAKWMQRRS